MDNITKDFEHNVYGETLKNSKGTIFANTHYFSSKINHYRKWNYNQIIEPKKDVSFNIHKSTHEYIHAISNLCIILRFQHKINLLDSLENIYCLTIIQKDNVLLHLNHGELICILRSYSKQLKKILSILKHKNSLLLPLQFILMKYNCFSLISLDEISISFVYRYPEFLKNIELICEAFTLSPDHLNYKFGDNIFFNYKFNDYSIDKFRLIALDETLVIYSIVIECQIKSGIHPNLKITFDGMPFSNQNSEFMEFHGYKQIPENIQRYIFDYQSVGFQKSISDVSGLIYPNQNRFIQIETDIPIQICVMIQHKNVI